ncbi:MAG: YnbE family lipoprotein [Deltaproteobacteria bacterium]|nr:YnbE family lipoprotein [Deltaproteobacteria bacterium]
MTQIFALAAVLLLAAGCTPKVELKAPKEPIVINMNIRIEHELRIKIDKDVDQLIEGNEDLFGEVK